MDTEVANNTDVVMKAMATAETNINTTMAVAIDDPVQGVAHLHVVNRAVSRHASHHKRINI